MNSMTTTLRTLMKRQPRKGTRFPAFATVYLTFIIILVLFGPMLAPHDPVGGALSQTLHPPVWAEGGTTEFLLGTDQLGRDILSRLLAGARVTVLVAGVGVLVAGVVGMIVGLTAGYFGGLIDSILMRISEAALAIPVLVLGLALAAIFRPGVWSLIFIVAGLLWSLFAKLVRGEVLAMRELDYVLASRLLGSRSPVVILRHILPNILNAMFVMLSVQFGNTVVIAASLSFLGLGVPQPTPEWGLMMADARNYMSLNPWMMLFPGILLALTVLCLNVLSDWMRVKFEPKGMGN